MGNAVPGPAHAAPKLECATEGDQILCGKEKFEYKNGLGMRFADEKTNVFPPQKLNMKLIPIPKDILLKNTMTETSVVTVRRPQGNEPILDVKETGPSEWGWLHSIQYICSPKVTGKQLKRFVKRWGRCASCPKCRDHYGTKVKATNLNNLTIIDVGKFYNDLHNEVNQERGKKIWSFDDHCKWYKANHSKVWQYGLARGLYHAAISVNREEFIKLLDCVADLFYGLKIGKSIKKLVAVLQSNKNINPIYIVWKYFDTRGMKYDDVKSELKKLIL